MKKKELDIQKPQRLIEYMTDREIAALYEDLLPLLKSRARAKVEEIYPNWVAKMARHLYSDDIFHPYSPDDTVSMDICIHVTVTEIRKSLEKYRG
jgi:hypothetical protein